MADNQVEVKIVGSVDGSLTSAVQGTNAQLAAVEATAGRASVSMAGLEQTSADLAGGMRGAAAATEATTATIERSHGSVSTATREFRALFDELSSGRTRQTPGTLAIIGQRVLGLGPAALVAAGGVAALGAAFLYLEQRAKAAQIAEQSALAGSALANNLVSAGGIQQATQRLQQLPKVSAEVAQQTVQQFASMRGMTNSVMLSLADNVEVFAQAIGKSLPEAAAQLRAFMEAPAQNGPKFIDMLGASAAQVQKFQEAAKQGNAAAMSAGLEIFAQRMAAVDTKAGDLKRRLDDTKQSTMNLLESGDQFGFGIADSMKAADAAAAQLGSTIAGQKGHDLAAAMRDAFAAAGALPPSLEQIRLGVEKIGAESGRTKAQMLQDEIAYLNAALATAQKTNSSAEAQLAIEQMIAEKKIELASQVNSQNSRLAKEEKEEQLRAIEEEVIGTEKGSAEQIAALQKLYDTAVRLDGARSAQAIAAEKQLMQAKSEAAQQWMAQLAGVESSAIANDNEAAKAQMANVRGLFQEKEISAQQEISLMAGVEEKRYQLTANSLQELLTLWAGYPEKLDQINKQIEANERQHQQTMGLISREGAKDLTREYEQAWAPVTNGFNSMVRGIVSGNMTLVQAVERGAAQMAEDFIMQEMRQVEQTIFTETAKTGAVEAGNAARVVSNEAANAASHGSNVAAMSGQIMNDAKTAAANTYQAVSAIPVIGPALAPAAAAVAFGAVMAFDTLTSFDVGTPNVSHDMIAQIHQGEMIVPADFASGIRSGDLTLGGGGFQGGESGSSSNVQGGDTHYNINVSVPTNGREDAGAFGRKVAKAILQQVRMNNSDLRQALG